MAHDSTPGPAAVVSTDDDADEPLIRRRGHPHRHDPWFLADDDENMATRDNHVRNAIALRHSIERHIAERRLDAYVFVDLAWRFDARHRYYGLDPDVMLVMPAPPRADKLKSLRAWAPGHVPPKLGIEIVSDKTARKDYTVAPGKYAAGKVGELVIFDPDRHRLRDVDGPYVLQVWRRTPKGRMVRRYAGDGPFESEALGAWLVVIEGTLRIADDREGTRVWPTHEDAERAERAAKVVEKVRADTEHKRAEIERERAEHERERAEHERERAEAAQEVAARMLTRRVERRLRRALTATERATLDARLLQATAEVIDEELDALADEALPAWLARG
jgi:hypothetical protein